jgi:hypothetical protein
MKRRDWRIEQIRAIERELKVLHVASAILQKQLLADPSLLQQNGLEKRDYASALENLDATYLIRLFAEFETGLREAWKRACKKDTHPRMMDLLQAFAARYSIPEDWHARVDDVRKFRNTLVHEQDEEVSPIPIHKARGYLCRFFSRLPPDW